MSRLYPGANGVKRRTSVCSPTSHTGKRRVKESDSCPKPPPVYTHFSVGSGNTFQERWRLLAPLLRHPWFRHHPTRHRQLLSPASLLSLLFSAVPKALKAPCPGGHPAAGRAREEATHLFCMDFPSLFLLLFSEFMQSRPSHREQRPGTSFSRWISSFQKDCCLD